MADVRDVAPEVTGLTLEIVLPHPPSDDLCAAVYDCVGIVPDVKGPDRGLDVIDVIVAYLGVATMEAFRDRLGNAALERALRLLQAILKHGTTHPRSDPALPAAENDGEVRLVVGSRQGVTFIVDRDVADDGRAVAALLVVDTAEHADGATLRWHPLLGRWVPESPEDEQTR